MKLRLAETKDVSGLINLLKTYKHLFFDDFDSLDTSFITYLVIKNELLTIENDAGKAIGLFWFENPIAGLKTMIHLLVEPTRLKQVFREDIIEKALDYAFETLHVKKIKAQAMASQHVAMKLLIRFGFKRCGHLINETLKEKMPIDIYIFELHETDWKQHKGDQSNGIV